MYLEITKDTKDTKSTTQRRAVRVREAHVRPEEPVGAWRASHATLWFWKSFGDSRRPIAPIGPMCLTATYFGTSQTCRAIGSLEV